ncbi:hypothetical protein AB4P95_27875 [Pseudomonas sp. A1437]|uniref:hypothetical protein n=1 Tax=unclassified Pseudomonas TaxID=196821 RepID=UPI003783ED5C
MKIAYLEISGRQTGKTERLTGIARHLAAEGKSVVYVICNKYCAADSRMCLPGVTVIVDGDPLPFGIDPDAAIWIYDEFDFQKSVVVRDGAYYATTAEHLRVVGVIPASDDVLMQLLKANGYRHERHLLPDFLRELVHDHRAFMSPGEFRLSMLGEFQS